MARAQRLTSRTVAVMAMAMAFLATLTGCGTPLIAHAKGPAISAASPAPGRAHGYLAAVSCVGRSFCVAVGSDFSTGRSLAESWNGHRWRVMPGSAATKRLSSVSCTGRSFCMAVGDGAAQLWDGHRWWAVRTPRGAESDVLAVSCTKRSFCLAVGGEAAQRWNGTSWRILALPHRGLGLGSVACLTASFCMAVGSQRNHLGTVSLSRALRWDGTAWRATRPPSPGRVAALSGVACGRPSRCLAVGSRGHCRQPPQPLGQRCFFSLRWDGRDWKRVPSPAGTPLVANLACGSGAGCVATGDCNLTANCRGTTTLVWNGRTWQQRPAVAPGRRGSSLEGIACWHRTACLAAGGTATSSGALRPLAEAWNGFRWRVLGTP